MNFNITSKELWFWRIMIFVLIIMIFVLILVSSINYFDNRQQDKIIFRTVDIVSKLVETDTRIIQQLDKQSEINKNTTDILWEYGHKIYNK